MGAWCPILTLDGHSPLSTASVPGLPNRMGVSVYPSQNPARRGSHKTNTSVIHLWGKLRGRKCSFFAPLYNAWLLSKEKHIKTLAKQNKTHRQ